MFSQLFVLTSRGDTIVTRDYRGDVVGGVAEIFYRKIKTWKADQLPPIFNVEGINFIHIKRNRLYFVGTTKFNTSPAMAIELLTRISNLFKDYCGVLSEESLRLNFVLIYELLDEVIDFGYGQVTSTQKLKNFVYSEPITISEGGRTSIFKSTSKKTISSDAANKPISLTSKGETGKNEIFIDLLERMTVLFSGDRLIRADIDGSIIVKSFLKGNPEIKLGLSEDLNLGSPAGYGIDVDDINFHPVVDTSEFEASRILLLRPPDGEFTLMNYRMKNAMNVNMPFEIRTYVENPSDIFRIDVIIKIRTNLPRSKHGANVVVKFPVPKITSGCHAAIEGNGQSFQFNKADQMGIWKISKIHGGQEIYCRFRISLETERCDRRSAPKDIGPVSLDFEIPMHVSSGLKISYCRVFDHGRLYTPCRWVRTITYSDSYTSRFS